MRAQLSLRVSKKRAKHDHVGETVPVLADAGHAVHDEDVAAGAQEESRDIHQQQREPASKGRVQLVALKDIIHLLLNNETNIFPCSVVDAHLFFVAVPTHGEH